MPFVLIYDEYPTPCTTSSRLIAASEIGYPNPSEFPRRPKSSDILSIAWKYLDIALFAFRPPVQELNGRITDDNPEFSMYMSAAGPPVLTEDDEEHSTPI